MNSTVQDETAEKKNVKKLKKGNFKNSSSLRWDMKLKRLDLELYIPVYFSSKNYFLSAGVF
jgi:hypothetical protein